MNRLLGIVIVSLALALALAALAAPGAHAEPASRAQTLALIITNNHSVEIGRPDLRYADDDGAKYYDLFRMLGSDADVELLTEFDRDSEQLFPEARARAHPPTRAEVTAALARISARAREIARAGRASELYLVFAGHGDVDHGRGFLELRDGRLTSDDVEAILREVPATRVHVILDSCNSFFVLNPRKPGGRQIAVVEQVAQSLSARLPNVGVFLSTSAEAEVFEWSELQSGIFSHAVRSGLAGAADANGDGQVSYDELRGFVEIATARVKNPLYRPKVFSRAPGGRGGTPIVELTGAHARRLEIPPGPLRLTVRDPDELPWIDANEEPGAAITLYLPERWAARASLDEHAADGTLARRPLPPGEDPVRLAELGPGGPPAMARGPHELLSTLFAAPFGPAALAAWRHDVQHEPEPVYGVSSEDAERMRLLLAEVADTGRSGRRFTGTFAITYAATFAGVTLAIGDRDSRTWTLASEAALAGFGVYKLLAHSDGENLYDTYVAKMADPRADKARAVADAERELNRVADRERTGRRAGLVSGLVIVGVAGAVLIAAEQSRATDNERAAERLIGGTLGMVGLGAAVLAASPTSTERIRDLWMHDPDLSRMPRWNVSLAPTLGGGSLSLNARF